MSRSEDYLDQLLKGVSPEKTKNEVTDEDTLEENIFSDILEEFADSSAAEESKEDEDIFGEDFFDDDFLDDEFLKEFEMEMEKLENEAEETGEEENVLSLFDDLDSILSGAKEQMEAVAAPEPMPEPETVSEPEFAPELEMTTEPEVVVEPELEPNQNVMPEPVAVEEEPIVAEEGFSFADLFAEDSGSSSEAAPQEDADVLKILEGLDGIDLELDEEDGGVSAGEGQDFSALEGFLAASAADNHSETSDFGMESFAFDEESTDEVTEPEKKKGKKGKKEKKEGEKTGFLNKLGLILFGEDDEDEEEDSKKKTGNVGAAEGEITIGVASEDDLALFGEYSGGASSSTAVEEKVDKKAEKKAKKEKKKQEKKEKQEKAKKEKKAKPKKEKKPKPPKEPDNTPPLPKKPVILIFLMIASFVALVLIGANLLGYSNHITNAKNQYAKKNYSDAFAEISGMEMKGEDQLLYEKYHVMAMVSVELEAYESLMSQEVYDMALDCLVRTVGRAEKYREDAENYGCIVELNELESEAEEILSQTFGVSREEALELYAYRSKKEYSKAIADILEALGLER